jgi:hypothetical protein
LELLLETVEQIKGRGGAQGQHGSHWRGLSGVRAPVRTLSGVWTQARVVPTAPGDSALTTWCGEPDLPVGRTVRGEPSAAGREHPGAAGGVVQGALPDGGSRLLLSVPMTRMSRP